MQPGPSEKPDGPLARPTDDGVSILRRGEHRAGAEAIAAGHADYPTFRHLFPEPRRRARALRAFFAATVRDGIPFNSVFAVCHGQRVVATAVWLPPGAFPWSPRRKLAATSALTRVLAADWRAFPTFVRYGANVERDHPTEPHWYLEVLSVRPEHQRQGLGGRLVTRVLHLADRDLVPCYLETARPANVDYYQRFGFEVMNPALEVIPGGPPLITMRRAEGSAAAKGEIHA
jgi:ribosomal protein S18 acetylase RimI-like enzyme